MAKSDEKKLEFYPTKPFSDDSLVPSVMFHDSKCPLSLDRSVHPQSYSLDTF